MATDARLHAAFSSAEHPSMAGFNALSLSINDVMPVSNATTQASQAAALSTAGVTFSSVPLVTARADAPGLHRLEYSYDGSVFLPASGILHFASTSARDTWTTANSAYLTAGDYCDIGGVAYYWTGTAWDAPALRQFYAATSGQHSFSGLAANTPASVNITFPAGLFTAAPMVFCTTQTGSPLQCGASTAVPTTSGFTLYAERGDSVGTLNVFWIAVQTVA